MGAPITERQLRYIEEHMNDMPRQRVADAAGCGLSTLYRALRRMGAEMHYGLSRKRPGVEDTVRELWPVMSASEIEAATGISASRVKVWARTLGVEHTPETAERLRAKSGGNRRGWTEERRRESGRRRRAVYRLERLRQMSGEPRKTRLRIAALPGRTGKAVWRLVRNRGYSPHGRPLHSGAAGCPAGAGQGGLLRKEVQDHIH